MGKTTQLGALCSVLIKYHSGNHIKKIKVGRACSKYGEEDRCIQDFGGEI
jgi:hypothetical protein